MSNTLSRGDTGKARAAIRVLIVDDSSSVREFLRNILSDGGFEVAGEAADGAEAVELAARLRPDVITMDISLPVMDGFAATRAIMASTPTPIVIVSGQWAPEEVAKTFDALGAGALAILEKPRFGTQDFACRKEQLVSTIKIMAEVKVVRRRTQSADRTKTALPRQRGQLKRKLVAMGASSGGPQTLRAILSGLPKDFPAPIVVVQHISRGFLPGLVQWLNQGSKLTVCIAAQGQAMEPGTVYFAPDDHHLLVARDNTLHLSDAPPEGTLRPCVGQLFRSVAEFLGSRAVGVLLTGMGRDGALELGLMRERGAVTIAQDKCTSIVYGMPREAVRLGAAVHVLPQEEIAGMLIGLLSEFT
ncbi:MAG: chemotaxis-specific protein-glutamate methyltransferase CheB [Desulfocurvibacter africanus]